MDCHPNAATNALDAGGGEAGDAPAPHRMATDSLDLRRVHPDELGVAALHDLFAGVAAPDEVFALCGWDAHDDESETREYLDERAEQWATGEFYEYVLAADDEDVGTACVQVVDDGACEFGCWLDRPYWGRGFSAEATDALVHVAFERLDAPFVVVGCLPANDRSRRAIESFARRYGGAYAGSPPTVSDHHDGDDAADAVVPHHEWTVTREAFDAGDEGLSTLVPGVEYGDLDF